MMGKSLLPAHKHTLFHFTDPVGQRPPEEEIKDKMLTVWMIMYGLKHSFPRRENKIPGSIGTGFDGPLNKAYWEEELSDSVIMLW